MSPLLRVLMLVDTVAEADMLARELGRTGFALAVRRATSEAAYQIALDSPLDLILADTALPAFDAMRALQILRTSELDIPLIVVTESAGEPAAIECVSLGAADYLFKDQPARLATAVVHALDQRELRRYARMADAALHKSAAINQSVLDALSAHIAMLNMDGVIVAVNQAWERFARANGDPHLLHTCVGINYLEVCRTAVGDNSAEAQQVRQGIAAVLAGKLDQFTIDYACNSPNALVRDAGHAIGG
ncbi:MAG: response regulator [Chloroflexota bacterium]|nr:response regulator [Chloroflexota bacterium]